MQSFEGLPRPETPQPKIPETLEDVRRAIVLLGCISRGPLQPKTRNELKELLGICPHPYLAKRWKRELKQMVKSFLEAQEEDLDFDDDELDEEDIARLADLNQT